MRCGGLPRGLESRGRSIVPRGGGRALAADRILFHRDLPAVPSLLRGRFESFFGETVRNTPGAFPCRRGRVDKGFVQRPSQGRPLPLQGRDRRATGRRGRGTRKPFLHIRVRVRIAIKVCFGSVQRLPSGRSRPVPSLRFEPRGPGSPNQVTIPVSVAKRRGRTPGSCPSPPCCEWIRLGKTPRGQPL